MPPSSDQLLRYAAWTRQLARSLVANEALADDIAQETWLSALRRPPDTREPLEPWLRTVVRHHVFNRARESKRREAREKQSEMVEAAESSEELLGRLESHKVLVEAVSGLAEPYRQMILLRYFEGLSSPEIGARENLPPGTVRGRLKTALELLREALDARHGSRVLWLGPIKTLSRSPTTSGDARPPSAPKRPRARLAKGLAAGGSPAMLACSTLVAVVATIWWAARDPAAGVARKAEANDTRVESSAGPAPNAERTWAPLPPPRRSPSLGGFSITPAVAAAATYRRDGRCSIAVEGDGPVAKACARGGTAAAKTTMKEMVKRAKAKGLPFPCEGCHKDLESFALREGARDGLDNLRALLGERPSALDKD